MATSVSPHLPEHHHDGGLRPSAAFRPAWFWYLALLFIPFLMFVAVFMTLQHREGALPHQSMRNAWFIGSILFLLLAAPIAFAVRSRLFRSYWRGEAVAPRAYLAGMLIVWGTLEIGGLLSLVGCLMSNSMTPCILPAVAAFLFFAPLWPNGSAMARPAGNTDDPEIYAEPR